MGKKLIRLSLDAQSIDQAIKEIKEYKKELERKTDLLRKRIADEIAQGASSGFASAIVDDIIGGESRTASVEVNVDEHENMSVVIAKGEDAVWVEFGAGVYHNTSPGTSPHPKGQELGFTIGSFGRNGRRTVWGFYEDGTLRLTHGTPAAMPMYSMVQAVCDRIDEIAREVFG